MSSSCSPYTVGFSPNSNAVVPWANSCNVTVISGVLRRVWIAEMLTFPIACALVTRLKGRLLGRFGIREFRMKCHKIL